MPPIFKALATITVWVLFIFGWIFLVVGNIGAAIGGSFFGATPPPLQVYLANGLGGAFFILSVVCMKLRQMLE